jgi:hypothetical protein
LSRRDLGGSDAATQSFTVALTLRAFLRAAISILSSLIKFEIARLDVRSDANTPDTNRSTRPEAGSNILIKSDPLGVTEQVQGRGNKPFSLICRSSSAEIMAFLSNGKFEFILVHEILQSRNVPK